MHFNTKLIPLENPYKPIIKKDLYVSFTKTSRRRYIILTVLGKSRDKAASSFYKRTILLIKLDKDCRQRKLKANFISDHLCLKQNFCIHAKTSSGRKFPALSVTRHWKSPLGIRRCHVPPFIPWPCQSLPEPAEDAESSVALMNAHCSPQRRGWEIQWSWVTEIKLQLLHLTLRAESHANLHHQACDNDVPRICVCLGSGNGWLMAVLVGGCLFRSQGTSWYSSRSQEGLWLPRPAHRDHRSSSVGGTKSSLFSLNSWTHIQKQFLGVFLSMIFCFHSFGEVVIILLFAPIESSNIIISPCH